MNFISIITVIMFIEFAIRYTILVYNWIKKANEAIDKINKDDDEKNDHSPRKD